MVVKRLLLLIICLPAFCGAQNTQLEQHNENIDGVTVQGFSVELSGPSENVRSSLVRFLKTYGKAKASSSFITVPEPTVEGNRIPGILYATATENGNRSIAWIGLASPSGEESAFDHDLKELTYNFAVTYQREQIQLQIDESLRALQAVERQQARLQNQNRDLNNKVENNKREKIALEQALIDNKSELEELTGKLATNAHARDSVGLATEQIRKVLEMHRARQRNVK